MWSKPVTDRTLSDVEYARMNRANAEHLKGARNYTDMMRITGNIHYLAKVLGEYGYSVTPTCKTSWGIGEFPAYSEINKIRVDLDALKNAYSILPGTPTTPVLPYSSYQKINDVEKILFDINHIFNIMIGSWFMSGEIMSGEA